MGLLAVVVGTPIAGMALQSQLDPEGFRTATDALFPASLSKILQQVALGASSQPTKQPPSSPPKGGLATVPPPALDRPDVTVEGQKAAREHQAMIKEAARVYLETAEREAAEERAKREQTEKKMRMELEQLAVEAKRLREENQALKGDAASKDALRLPPQVVFQELRLTDELREKLEDLQANRTAERIAQLLQQPLQGGDASHSKSAALGSVNERGIDPLKEVVFAPGTSLDAVQKRIKELLVELDCRTRLEGIRLREAIMQTEEKARAEHLQMLAKQLAAQEKELQRIMSLQVEEIQKKAHAEVTRRDAAWEAKIRDEWDAINKRSEDFADAEVRVKEMRGIIERLEVLEQDKKVLAAAFQDKANERIKTVENLRLEVQAAGGVLSEVVEEKDNSADLRGLALAAMGAIGALDQKRPLAEELSALEHVAKDDEVVAIAFSSLPSGVATGGVASAADLGKGFESVSKLARRALLVPEEGGFLAEASATLRVPFLSNFKDDSLPSGDSPELPLRRAKFWMDRGKYDKALDELKTLDPRAKKAMNSWMEEAKKRLLVEQALRLIRSHALAELSRYC